jgi:hypothetical protein
MYAVNYDTGKLEQPLARSRKIPVGSSYKHLADPLILTLYDTLKNGNHSFIEPGVPPVLLKSAWYDPMRTNMYLNNSFPSEQNNMFMHTQS